MTAEANMGHLTRRLGCRPAFIPPAESTRLNQTRQFSEAKAQTTCPEQTPPGTACRIPLLALHGFTGCGKDFQWLVTQTADLFDWHTWDFPGHGTNATAPQSAHTPAAVTRTIDAALGNIIAAQQGAQAGACTTSQNAATESARNCAQQSAAPCPPSAPATTPETFPAPSLPLLLGYSMGGRMALRYLAQAGTAKVRGLILIGASAGLVNESERRTRRHSDHALASRIETAGIDAFMQHWNRLPLIASQSRSPYFPQLQQMRRANNATGLARSLRGIGTGAVAPVHRHLPQISIPCLLLTGAEDTKFTAIAAHMATCLPRAQHVIIPDAGHSPHWENPQATKAAIRVWLASASASVHA